MQTIDYHNMNKLNLSLPPKNNSLTRTILMSLLVIGVAFGVYAYNFVIIFKSEVRGLVYGETTSSGGNYTLHTLKYYYTFNGITYFDEVDYLGENELEVGDSLIIRVLKPYPPKHAIQTIYRNHKNSVSYNAEDFFETQYHMHINELGDYSASEKDTIITPNENRLIYPVNAPDELIQSTITSIDAIQFNRGSLIDFFILRDTPDTLYLHPVYFYLDQYSVDGHPALAMHNNLKQLIKNKHIHLSVLDKKNAKHERILKPLHN